MKTGRFTVIVSFRSGLITEAFRFHKLETMSRIAKLNSHYGTVMLVGLTYADFAGE